MLIVTDEDRAGIAEAVRTEAAAAADCAEVVVPPPRSIDNEEPIAAVSVAMAKADVIFLVVSHSLAHTRATREAIAGGARVVSMSAFTERQMREGGLFVDFRVRRVDPMVALKGD